MSGDDNSMSYAQRRSARTSLLKRDGNKCFYCGLPMSSPTIEHLENRSDGGNHSEANLVLAHGTCNKFVGAASLNTKFKVKKLNAKASARKIFLARAIKACGNKHRDFLIRQLRDQVLIESVAKS